MDIFLLCYILCLLQPVLAEGLSTPCSKYSIRVDEFYIKLYPQATGRNLSLYALTAAIQLHASSAEAQIL